jgi:hypothetical protein
MGDAGPLISLLVVNIDFKLVPLRSVFATLSAEDEPQGPGTLSSKHTNGIVLSASGKPIYTPIIRVFGSSDSGQRVCAHIHDVRHFSSNSTFTR